jgi:hypothetical protein
MVCKNSIYVMESQENHMCWMTWMLIFKMSVALPVKGL